MVRRIGRVEGAFKKCGLKMNLDKTEVMWVGKQREELNIRLEGKDIIEFCVPRWSYVCERASGVATQNTSRSECRQKRRGGNDGQKDFLKTEGEGPGILRSAS